MNYLGHAAVASWFSTEPAFVLGSMVPDFAGFLRLTLPEPSNERLRAGMTCHHETDRVFHATTAFRSLNRAAALSLAEACVPHGPARAVAHVGVEMLIDVAMAENPDALASFYAALDTLEPRRIRDALPMKESDHAQLVRTAAIVRERGAELWAPDPPVIAARIARTFAKRRRLQLESEALPIVTGWVAAALGQVREAIPALEAELRLGLEAEWLEPYQQSHRAVPG